MTHPQQLLLDILPAAPPPSFNNFITGRNHELISRLQTLGERSAFDQFYLWGEPGSGRSHLLQATRQLAQQLNRPTCWIEASQLQHELRPTPGSLVIIDDVDTLGPEAQITLFRTFNAARLVGLAILLAGSSAPLQLKLREDLRTRIGAALIYEVHALSDDDKQQALIHYAAGQGMRIDETALAWLLQHGRRDLSSLLAVLDTADRLSLERQRLITLPLLREALAVQHAACHAGTAPAAPRQTPTPATTDPSTFSESTPHESGPV